MSIFCPKVSQSPPKSKTLAHRAQKKKPPPESAPPKKGKFAPDTPKPPPMSAFFRVSMALLLLGKPAALLAQFSDMEVFTSLDEALLNPSHVVALSLD